MNKFLLNNEECGEYSIEIYKRMSKFWDEEVKNVSHLNISPDAWLNTLLSSLCAISSFNLARVCAAFRMDKATFTAIVTHFCCEISENAHTAFNKAATQIKNHG